ncbi:MAG: alanine--tRNA ligase [Pseudomonadota bacterium]
MRANEIRTTFLNFFEKHGHEVRASAPLVPQNDPTLMFVNAGMVPFKNIFTGAETPSSPRAVSAQKCVRAGGKHNDLDNVGQTARHHTFFEMLGNFSFGDYFKPDAIEWAWSLLTKDFGLPSDRLLVTVYHDDDDAFALWKKIAGLPDDRILRIATADNFWSMGDTGPCGPCSEIFFDHGPDLPGGPPGSADEDGDRFVEIWNLVFMQFDQLTGGARTNLPKPCIDTGMGLERIAAVLQGTHDNYRVDSIRLLIEASAAMTGTDPDGPAKLSHRILADHLRAGAFLIADGVMPANEGRGYVLRRILRRAMRHAHEIGDGTPLMYRLVPALVGEMGAAYPELGRAQASISATLRQEEERFQKTLDRGLRLLEEELGKLGNGGTLSGDVAFKLYDTYGFPADLTETIANERAFSVDKTGFQAAMAAQKETARASWSGSGAAADDKLYFDLKDTHGATEFLGYHHTEAPAQIVALIKDGVPVDALNEGDEGEVLLNQTPFYGESGGQTGDIGVLSAKEGIVFEVQDTQKPLGVLHAHRGKVKGGGLTVGGLVDAKVDEQHRNRVRANHSATHLLHSALRQVLGDHVTQKGSLVTADRLRFDFSHGGSLGREELAEIENRVNAIVLANAEVTTRVMAPDEAINAGALALFGEKYGEEVRVLFMGPGSPEAESGFFSIEFCGGTHVERLGDIGPFVIVGESAVAAGIRRVEALTGEAALGYLRGRANGLETLALMMKTTVDEAQSRLAQLLEDRKTLERELAKLKQDIALGKVGGAGEATPKVETIGDVSFVGEVLPDLGPKDLRTIADTKLANFDGPGIVSLIGTAGGKVALVVAVSETLVSLVDAVTLVRAGSEAVGGKGGGGRPTFAQAGGPEVGKAAAAIDAIRTLAGTKLAASKTAAE